jgi:predicted phosphodiesterase
MEILWNAMLPETTMTTVLVREICINPGSISIGRSTGGHLVAAASIGGENT